jgi:transposase-like protein
MSGANARLMPAGRLLLVNRIDAGTTQVELAHQMRLWRGTVAKWWHRYQAEGAAGLGDRSSRPHRCPTRTASRIEERICRLRRSTNRSPA